MTHTIKEAKELWCPMVRIARVEPVHVAQPDGSTKDSDVAFANVGGCNTGGHSARSPASCRCIADQCAMWRWDSKTKLVQRTPEHGWADFVTINIFGRSMIAVKVEPTHGYCGLAGRPDVMS